MALDDVTKSAMEVGEVKSSLKPENVEMTEQFWEVVASHYPSLLYWDADGMSEKQIRYFISLLDKVIQDEVAGMKTTGSQVSEAEDAREELLEYI